MEKFSNYQATNGEFDSLISKLAIGISDPGKYALFTTNTELGITLINKLKQESISSDKVKVVITSADTYEVSEYLRSLSNNRTSSLEGHFISSSFISSAETIPIESFLQIVSDFVQNMYFINEITVNM